MSAIVLGMTEVAKKFGLTSKWAPVFAIFLGITISVGDAFNHGKIEWFSSILKGALIGIATTGTYAAVNKFIAKARG